MRIAVTIRTCGVAPSIMNQEDSGAPKKLGLLSLGGECRIERTDRCNLTAGELGQPVQDTEQREEDR
ncbi:hypothetical protein [Salana multivorans]